MRIYVGRWDLLPENWKEGNFLSKATETQIQLETTRQWITFGDRHIECYSPEDFEEIFNHQSTFQKDDYWIRIFD